MLVTFDNTKKTYWRLSKIQKNDKGHSNVYIYSGSEKNNDVKLGNAIQGRLAGIEAAMDTYQGEEIPKLKFKFIDLDGSIQEFSCGRYSAFSLDVLNMLNAEESIDYVRLTPFINVYEGKEYVHGSIRVGSNYDRKGTKIYLHTDIPKLEPVLDGKGKPVLSKGKPVLSSEKREKFIDDLIAKAQRKINPNVADTITANIAFDNLGEDDSDIEVPF
jgi:hypothetical protein